MKTFLTLAVLLVGFVAQAEEGGRLERSLTCREHGVDSRVLSVTPIISSGKDGRNDALSVSISRDQEGLLTGIVYYSNTTLELAYYNSRKKAGTHIQQVRVNLMSGSDHSGLKYSNEIGVLIDDPLQTDSSLYITFYCYEQDNQ